MPTMRQITKIILHCSASPDGRDDKVDDIRRWHLDNGWSDIGYHFVIHRDGTIHTGRPIDQIGAHTRGQNRDSVGVCLVGTSDFTKLQLLALVRMAGHLEENYALTADDWFCHYQFSSKTCPNIPVILLREWLKKEDPHHLL